MVDYKTLPVESNLRRSGLYIQTIHPAKPSSIIIKSINGLTPGAVDKHHLIIGGSTYCG